MKKTPVFCFFILFGTLSLTSCIKDEALNKEADIVSATLSDTTLLDGNPSIGNDYVDFSVNSFPEDTMFSPKFTLTPGAQIDPDNNTERNFSKPRQYTVTSEDGEWEKTYEVSFALNEASLLHYSFENADIKTSSTRSESGYNRFYELTSGGEKSFIWDSGNLGYDILVDNLLPDGEELSPDFYPTRQIDDGYKGKGAKLTTKETGALGETVGSEMAAGNLFLGEFKLTFPPIKSPHFGQSYKFDSAPVALKGYFKYKAGDKFENKGDPTDRTEDTWDAYAILFEKKERRKDEGGDNDFPKRLPGNHEFKDPRMVSIARIPEEDRIETDEWTEFYLPFEDVNGKSYDPDKDYMYTIVFTSSIEGDLFNGAIGSTLWIDEVELVTEDTQDD